MWLIRHMHLGEDGIHVADTDIPLSPEKDARYEQDLHDVATLYCGGSGGFWLAYAYNAPVGYVGAQQIGQGAELRRMYVHHAYRRNGIGLRLCGALLEHCDRMGITAIELWTARDGAGRRLYENLGFQQTETPGPGFESVVEHTGYTPGANEIRMRKS